MTRTGRGILLAILIPTVLALSGVVIGIWRQPLVAVADTFPRPLIIPVQGASTKDIQDTFNDTRDGVRKHEAVDIIAPRGTPVVAADDGVVKKLFLSKPGGITLYQFDPTEQYCYYYAHLNGYAAGVHEGMKVQRGQVIAYVGSTGNADPNAPHLHFAILLLGPEKRWWQGTPIDPYPVLIQLD